MSKHFELMQQLEQESRTGSATASRPFTASKDSRVVSSTAPGAASDEVSLLIQKVFFSNTLPAPQVVVIAGVDESAGSAEKCNLVARTLAAQTAKAVCLVEANIRNPSLDLAPSSGMRGSIAGSETSAVQVTRIDDNDLWFSPSHTLTDRFGGLLPLALLKDHFSQLRKEFEFVIVNAAPLSTCSDGVVLGQISDGVIMIVEANATRRKAVSAVTESLRAMQIPILAAILNNRTFPIPKAIYDRL